MDLARRNARTILACRSRERGQAAAEEIRAATGNPNVVPRLLDSSSLASVRAFAGEVLREEKRLDVLVNNAGLTGTPRAHRRSAAVKPRPHRTARLLQGCPSPSRPRAWSGPSPPTTWARSCSPTCCWVSEGCGLGAGSCRAGGVRGRPAHPPLRADLMKASAPARIVTVSSFRHSAGTADTRFLTGQARPGGFDPVYNSTKLMNVLFTAELAQRLQGTGG